MTDSAAPQPPFVHLHVHSSYSLSEGAIKAEKLASLAKDAGMPAVALTDTANLFGTLEFSLAAAGKGVQPIMGCQLWLSRSASDERPEAERQAPDPVVALAMDAQGLDNLQRLSSRSFLANDASGKPCLKLATLQEHAAGLILLTGGTTGPIARLLSEGRRDPAQRLLETLRESFPDRLVVELHRHGLEIERAVEPALLALADDLALPIVAANDVYFARTRSEERRVGKECRSRRSPDH